MDANRRRIPRPLIVAMACAVMALAACSSAASTLAPDDRPDGRPAAAAPTSVASTPAPLPAATGAEGPPAPNDEAIVPDGALIVRTGTLQLDVADVDDSVTRARLVVAALGGYISGSDEHDDGRVHVASITYRIPAANWTDAIVGIRALATTVVSESTASDEVTSQVVDLAARISNKRATEIAIQGFMDRATTIDEVLAVQDRLTAVRQEIEQLVAQQDTLTAQAALATLTVVFQGPVAVIPEPAPTAAPPTAAPPPGWELGAEVERASAQTIRAGEVLASFLVWVVVVGIPVLGLPLLMIGLVFWLLVRRRPRTT